MQLAILRWVGLAILLLLVGCTSSQPTINYQPGTQYVSPGQTRAWNFDSDSTLPTGAEVFSGSWAVRAEADAPSQPNALCQTGTATYPAMSLGGDIYTDAAISAKFKPISGQTDRAGGIIFRIQDKDNYYILRANALENNVNIYKYVGGQRSSIKEASAPVPSSEWQVLRVEVQGNRIQGFLNNQLVVEATDDTFKAGRIGLWTKSDSTTCFDDVSVTAK